MSRLKKGLQNIDKIADATVKRVLGIGEDQANKRLGICSSCDSALHDAVFGGKMCGGGDDPCYCNIKTLVYSDKKCPLGKWENTI